MLQRATSKRRLDYKVVDGKSAVFYFWCQQSRIMANIIAWLGLTHRQLHAQVDQITASGGSRFSKHADPRTPREPYWYPAILATFVFVTIEVSNLDRAGFNTSSGLPDEVSREFGPVIQLYKASSDAPEIAYHLEKGEPVLNQIKCYSLLDESVEKGSYDRLDCKNNI